MVFSDSLPQPDATAANVPLLLRSTQNLSQVKACLMIPYPYSSSPMVTATPPQLLGDSLLGNAPHGSHSLNYNSTEVHLHRNGCHLNDYHQGNGHPFYYHQDSGHLAVCLLRIARHSITQRSDIDQ